MLVRAARTIFGCEDCEIVREALRVICIVDISGRPGAVFHVLVEVSVVLWFW